MGVIDGLSDHPQHNHKRKAEVASSRSILAYDRPLLAADDPANRNY